MSMDVDVCGGGAGLGLRSEQKVCEASKEFGKTEIDLLGANQVSG